LSTGEKTYNGSINWSNWPAMTGRKLSGETIAEYAHSWGRKVGTISSVEWSHATPAGLGGAHNFSRNNYSAIANEMLNGGWIDVIMGAGNPEYSDDNVIRATPEYKYVGGQSTWNALKSGTLGGWTLVQSKYEFDWLADADNPPAKVVGTAQVATTLQQARAGAAVKHGPFDAAYPMNKNVPDLATMSRAALNVLAHNNPHGFLLHIEGGAIDWAGHANQPGRIIEEQVDFNKAVAAVVDWVETNSSWDKTLLIVTADHETGLVLGPNSATKAFDPIVNNGKGVMPGIVFNSNSHSNQLVPVYMRGPGTAIAQNLAMHEDPVRGAYIDNTQIFTLMYNVMRPKYDDNYLAGGSIEFIGGWKMNRWMGMFWDGFYPWIYLPAADGWTYVWEDGCDGDTWLYSESEGWFWSAEGWYPWCWSQKNQEWFVAE
ncbi:MAG TPA: alkaline phosphatase, partial [Opitutales bacterium]|nr:alkaline phosphatase [Opitutales bacterium]